MSHFLLTVTPHHLPYLPSTLLPGQALTLSNQQEFTLKSTTADKAAWEVRRVVLEAEIEEARISLGLGAKKIEPVAEDEIGVMGE